MEGRGEPGGGRERWCGEVDLDVRMAPLRGFNSAVTLPQVGRGSGRACGRLSEPENNFAGFGQAESFACLALDRFGIAGEGFAVGAQPLVKRLLFSDVLLEREDVLPQGLVLLDQGSVPKTDGKEPRGNEKQENHPGKAA